jgi:Phytanoyl-CoA dioxygenase (PhyH)
VETVGFDGNNYTITPSDHMLSDLSWWRLARIHGWTNGLSTALLNRLLVIGRRVTNTTAAVSATFCCELMPNEIARYSDEVRRNSYSLLPIRLDPSVCDDLVADCLSLKCEPFPPPASGPAEIALDLNHPSAPLNFFGLAQGIHRHPVVAALMNDPVLVAIARDYLRCEPILDACRIWASTAFGNGPTSEITQLFHYDASHPGFIKFFIYLTDVDSDNGPHCVVPGSHRADRAGWALRVGDRRITDERIARAYPGLARELIGPKGTVIAEDTRAFHKGKQPTRGYRFVLELYFVNVALGPEIPEAERLRS